MIEIGDDAYTRRFGGARVARRDVLHVEPVPGATFVGDVACADHLPSDAFDCVILTQTLHLIYDVRVALATVHRILKPGGQASGDSPRHQSDQRRSVADVLVLELPIRSLRQLLTETFQKGEVVVEAYGNVLAAIAFLHGLAAEELGSDELAYRDPAYSC